MSDLIVGILLGSVGTLVVVWLLLKFLAQRIAEELLADADTDDIDVAIKFARDAELEIPLYIELHNQEAFCYREDTDEFVAQGQSLKEIQQKFAQKFSNRKGRIETVSDNPEITEWLKQQMKNENTDSV